MLVSLALISRYSCQSLSSCPRSLYKLSHTVKTDHICPPADSEMYTKTFTNAKPQFSMFVNFKSCIRLALQSALWQIAMQLCVAKKCLLTLHAYSELPHIKSF